MRIKRNLVYLLVLATMLLFLLSACQTQKSSYASGTRVMKDKKVVLHGDVSDLQEDRVNPELKPAESYGLGTSVHEEMVVMDDIEPSSEKYPQKPQSVVFAEPILTDTYKTPVKVEDIYSVLIAEVAANRDQPQLALDHYLEKLRVEKHPAERVTIARRIADLAMESSNTAALKQGAETWVSLSPQDAQAHEAMGIYLIQTGRFAQAFDSFERAAVLGAMPRFDLITQNIHTVDVDRLIRLEQEYHRLHKKYPDHAALDQGLILLYRKQADIYYRKKQYQKSLDALNNIQKSIQSKDLSNHDAFLRYIADRKMQVAMAAGHYRQAMREAERKVAKYPDDLQARIEYNRVRLAYATEKNKSALMRDAEYELLQIAAQNQGDPVIFQQLATIAAAYETTKLKKLLQDFLLQQTYQKKSYETAHYYLGEMAQAEKKYHIAIRHYERVTTGELAEAAQKNIIQIILMQQGIPGVQEYIRSYQNRADAVLPIYVHLRIAAIEEFINQYAYSQAITMIHQTLDQLQNSTVKNIAVKPASGMDSLDQQRLEQQFKQQLYRLRGIAHAQIGNISKMRADFEQAIRLNPEDAETLNAYGYSLAEHKMDLQAARSMIERAIVANPLNLAYIDSLAWVMYRQGETDRSETLLTWLFFKDLQNNPELAAHLGAVLWQKGDKPNARWIWKTALEHAPGNRYLRFTLKKLRVDVDKNRVLRD